jgi:predicted transcriptional regulator
MRKPSIDIMKDILDILKKNKKLTIRQISLKAKVRWKTAKSNLENLEKLNLVREEKKEVYGKIFRYFYLSK